MAINFKRLEEISSSLKENYQTGKSHHVTFIYQGNKLIRIGKNNYKKLHRSHKYGSYVATKSGSNYVAGLVELDEAKKIIQELLSIIVNNFLIPFTYPIFFIWAKQSEKQDSLEEKPYFV